MEDQPSNPAKPRSRGRPKTANPRGIQSTASSLDVLKVMVAHSEPMHLREIAAAVGRGTSSVYRYLVSFVEAGLVKQDEGSGRYDLGPMALKLGLAALRRIDGVAAATEELARLVKNIDADGHVTVWGSNGPTVLRWLGRPSDVVVRVQEGWVLSLMGSSTGRTWAAYLPKDMLDAAVQHEFETRPAPAGSGTRTERKKALAQATEHIRAQGYSYATGELRNGVDALCAPIFNRHGTMVYAITLVSQNPGLTPQHHPEVVEQLLASTRSVSEQMGATLA
ncbi:HTH-type transcriptional regulator KipR [Pigmentiphaga humi]|uniref:HTH-type transcriptional regulator KipR n=1 Tax=Pigmentiphaga humi TaxID=2478468 RepID=A0A3P4B4P1_9BURK|nr:IclR family transcriptional regulator [Pigmentiphaga humi]VCU70901.1 HTH-type transcriptional regulator KipR [Pigmentiphaga humi]